MFVDELNKIKDSEAKAEKMQKDALAASRKNIEDAKTRAAKIIDEANDQASEIYRGLIAEGDKTSDKEYDSYLQQTEKDSGRMVESADDRKQKAIDLIAARIIGGK